MPAGVLLLGSEAQELEGEIPSLTGTMPGHPSGLSRAPGSPALPSRPEWDTEGTRRAGVPAHSGETGDSN